MPTPAYTLLIQELQEMSPENVTVPFPPNFMQTPEAQVQQVYHQLQHAKRRRDRQAILAHAFYLGEILENTSNRALRAYLNHQVTQYYAITSKRIYNVFEKNGGVEQLYRTTSITLSDFHRLLFAEYKLLLKD